MRRAALGLLLLAGIGVAAWGWSNHGAILPAIAAATVPASDPRDEFSQWLERDPARGQQFAQFEAMLAAAGADGIVPAWQLTRVDADYAARCDLAAFAIPPREVWPNIVPALRLVRDHVIPAVGPVNVHSAWRSPAVNQCVRGARASRHLTFSAMDLVTSEPDRSAALYRRLCAMQRSAGAGSRMGLGAYYRLGDPDATFGRFHIDAQGFRNWGFDYTSASSPCAELLRLESSDAGNSR